MTARSLRGLLVVLPTLLSCCVLDRTAIVPVTTITHTQRPGGRASTLIIFLPGKQSDAGDFDREHFIDLARARGLNADLLEADLHLGYYLDGTYSTRLWEDVVAPARAAGTEHVWLVGISLGGSGAIGFAREYPDVVAGLVLLSPYLGPPEISETIRAAGGLAAWTPGPSAESGSFESFVVRNWSFLGQVCAAGARTPIVYLGYGRDEPMAPSLDLLADSLPAAHVVRVPGGHRWKTWQALWKEMLSHHLFDEPKAGR